MIREEERDERKGLPHDAARRGELADGKLVGVSALYPLYYHDPWLYRYVTGHDERALRWFDGRGCIVYPGVPPAGVTFAFSEEAPLHPTLRDEFAQHAALVERVEGKDIFPAYFYSFFSFSYDPFSYLSRV